MADFNFNDGLLVKISTLNKTVAFVDMAYYVNLFEGSPGGYGFNNGEGKIVRIAPDKVTIRWSGKNLDIAPGL